MCPKVNINSPEPRITYEVSGWFKFAAEDTPEQGEVPGTETSFSGTDLFVGVTVDALIQTLKHFVGVHRKDADCVLLDACDQPGRIDISVMETADGLPATGVDIQHWHLGGRKLFSCIYSFVVQRVTRQQLSLTGPPSVRPIKAESWHWPEAGKGLDEERK